MRAPRRVEAREHDNLPAANARIQRSNTATENSPLQRRADVRYCKHPGGGTACERTKEEITMGDKNPKKKPKPKADKTKK